MMKILYTIGPDENGHERYGTIPYARAVLIMPMEDVGMNVLPEEIEIDVECGDEPAERRKVVAISPDHGQADYLIRQMYGMLLDCVHGTICW